MVLARATKKTLALGVVVALLGARTGSASAQDLAAIVAKAREQVESGAYADALKTLAGLPSTGVPDTLAVEASLLETTASLVSKGEQAGQAACAKAVVAAGYDPEVARDQSPKVRAACRAAAAAERSKRVARAGVTFGAPRFDAVDVAWQSVRVSTKASSAPAWLRVVVRVTSSAIEGSFDLPLVPSADEPLRGTLDAAWIRPRAKIKLELVAQDRFGDLGATGQSASFDVPDAEAAISLGDVPAGAVVLVDGAKTAPAAGGRVNVLPGAHIVTLDLADGATATARVDVARGTLAHVALAPQRPATSRTFAIIATGAAVTFGVGGTIFLANAASKSREIEDLAARREPGTQLPATSYADIASKDSERKTFNALGVGFFAGAGAAAVTAAVLWLFPSGSRRADKAARITPRIGARSLSVGGTF